MSGIKQQVPDADAQRSFKILSIYDWDHMQNEWKEHRCRNIDFTVYTVSSGQFNAVNAGIMFSSLLAKYLCQ